ncbi:MULTISPECIES: hypothetical protein [unclassified Pseudoalteromonas]|uniref:hypothetical protein n=1 Tax=unclassified Pseudoalteromonas TaxID=194690 RepID=UPI000C105AAF|nr:MULTISPECIES: hypothetical protein [unclassified Pseudoalteromonas]MBL1386032.1 hypothetical protein [Colwellia sp.]TMS82834.1 hypothetical protein CWB65_02445 [Pseudoalteromonas sp. S554]UOB74787.1 hypothetical protein MTP24_06700 [Pseudoalteromonas sp. APM04]BBW91740.1 hypothetical protein PS1M3_18270 [Pseudoalteromonas sp. PS1M3]|tara:strand:- start:43 stop:507 length:465 start_codon:yes stop_codon:yes gene_type:complete
MQTYTNKPDVLELVVSKGFLDKLSIRRIEYPFGEGKEEYCYFNNILIGEISGDAGQSKIYYEGLNISYVGHVVIKLTPVVTKNEYLLFPKYEEFSNALNSLINTANNFIFICEADCEQNEVEENPDMKKVLRQLQGFCIGEHYNCPTFIQRKEM